MTKEPDPKPEFHKLRVVFGRLSNNKIRITEESLERIGDIIITCSRTLSPNNNPEKLMLIRSIFFWNKRCDKLTKDRSERLSILSDRISDLARKIIESDEEFKKTSALGKDCTAIIRVGNTFDRLTDFDMWFMSFIGVSLKNPPEES